MSVESRATIKGYFNTGDKPTESQFGNLLDSVWMKGDSIPVDGVTYGIQTLTYGSTTTWDIANGQNAELTLTGNTTLAIVNLLVGQVLLLVVHQDGTGSRTITLPAGSKVGYGGAGAVTLTTTPNAIDILTCFNDGTRLYWLINKQFT